MTSDRNINVEILADFCEEKFFESSKFLDDHLDFIWGHIPWKHRDWPDVRRIAMKCYWLQMRIPKLHQIAKKGTQIRCDREFSNDAIVFAVNTLRLISQSPAHTALRLQLKINGNTTMMNHESPPTATFKGYKMIKKCHNNSLHQTHQPTSFKTTRCEKLVKKNLPSKVDTVNWRASRLLSLSDNS